MDQQSVQQQTANWNSRVQGHSTTLPNEFLKDSHAESLDPTHEAQSYARPINGYTIHGRSSAPHPLFELAISARLFGVHGVHGVSMYESCHQGCRKVILDGGDMRSS